MVAESFIKALTERRLICSVKKVSSSGTSRKIFFGEFRYNQDGGFVYQFNWFIGQLGFKYDKQTSCVSVKGCGMDMIFNTLDCVCGVLKDNGFDLPENFSRLCCDYHSI